MEEVRAQREALLKKRQEGRRQAMDTYQAGRTEDEESKKQELIKRGLAALNIEGAAEAKQEDM